MVNTYINRAIHKMEKQTQEKKNTYIQVQTRTMDVIIHLPRRTIGLEAPEALEALEVLEALEALDTLEVLEVLEVLEALEIFEAFEVLEVLEALEILEALETSEARETLEALEIAACERGQKRATNEPCGRRMK